MTTSKSNEAFGIAINSINRSDVLVSCHYLKIILEQSTPDFRPNSSDDPGKDSNEVKHVATING